MYFPLIDIGSFSDQITAFHEVFDDYRCRRLCDGTESGESGYGARVVVRMSKEKHGAQLTRRQILGRALSIPQPAGCLEDLYGDVFVNDIHSH